MTPVHVRVRVAGEDYGLPVEYVREVAEYGEVAPVPGAPAPVLGVRNLRGDVVPVVDLGLTLGLPPATRRERLAVVEQGGRRAALAVDSVDEVEQLPEATEAADSPSLAGAVLTDGALVGLVDLAAVLDAAQGGAVA